VNATPDGALKKAEADVIARHKFQALLVALLLMLVAYPALRGPAGAPLHFNILITAMFLAGAWALFADRRLRFVAFILGGPAVWTGYRLPEEHDPAAGGV
jgi:hypothetical protein